MVCLVYCIPALCLFSLLYKIFLVANGSVFSDSSMVAIPGSLAPLIPSKAIPLPKLQTLQVVEQMHKYLYGTGRQAERLKRMLYRLKHWLTRGHVPCSRSSGSREAMKIVYNVAKRQEIWPF